MDEMNTTNAPNPTDEVIRLKEFINDYDREMKWIITNDVSLGNSVIKKLNREGISVKGCRILSPEDIANQIVSGYYADSRIEPSKKINIQESAYLLHSLFDHPDDSIFSNSLRNSISLKTSEEILRVINIIREGKKRNEKAHGKQNRIKKIIQTFEKKMKQSKLMDKVFVLQKAISLLEKKEKFDLKLYLATQEPLHIAIDGFAYKRFSYLEREFLKLLKNKLGYPFNTVEWIEDEHKQQDNSPEQIEFVKAYGQYNEVNYCRKFIKENKIHPGEVGIYYTNEIYEPLLKGIFENDNIGITFEYKNSADQEILYFINAILDSVQADFSFSLLGLAIDSKIATLSHKIKAFKLQENLNKEEISDSHQQIISDDLEKLQEESQANQEQAQIEATWDNEFFSLRTAYRQILKKEDVGASKKRYEDFLERHENIGEYSTLTQEENEKMAPFKEFLKDFISIYKEDDCVETIYHNLLDFVKTYSYRSLEKNAMLASLRQYASALKLLGKSDKNNSFELIRETIEKFKISQPEDMSKVRAHRLTSRHIASRPYNFIIGLSSCYVQKDTRNSPVLSDEEILEILDDDCAYIPLCAKKNLEFKEDFDQLSKSCESGKTIFIYSYYDIPKLTELSPSLLYIEKCEHEKEYSYHPYSKGLSFPIPIPNRRKTDDEKLKNRENQDREKEKSEEVLSLSATSLQKIVECPLRYYYNNIEKIRTKEIFRTGLWLNANEKGIFFHRIMELYCNQVFQSDAKIEAWKKDFDQDAFENSFKRAFQEMKIKVYHKSMEMIQAESKEIQDITRSYIEDLHRDYKRDSQNNKKWRVLGNELEFGPKKALEVPYYEDNQKIFLWNGSIDRLDAYSDENFYLHLKIIDYKTGSYLNLKTKIEGEGSSDSEYQIPKNRELQHYIYAIAGIKYIEENLENLKQAFAIPSIKGITIEKILFSFPFEEQNTQYDATSQIEPLEISFHEDIGMKERIELPNEVKKIMLQVIKSQKNQDIHNLVKTSEKYVMDIFEKEQHEKYPENQKICSYCDYKDICRMHIKNTRRRFV